MDSFFQITSFSNAYKQQGMSGEAGTVRGAVRRLVQSIWGDRSGKQRLGPVHATFRSLWNGLIGISNLVGAV